jgi:hypothetical protein
LRNWGGAFGNDEYGAEGILLLGIALVLFEQPLAFESEVEINVIV